MTPQQAPAIPHPAPRPLSLGASLIALHVKAAPDTMRFWLACNCADDLALDGPAFDRAAFLLACGILPEATICPSS